MTGTTADPSPAPLDPSELQTPAHDSTPTMPIPDALRIRVGEGEIILAQVRTQGYIDAAAFLKLLDLVRDLGPIVLGAT